MPIGTVKHYNAARGFGFIKRDDGRRDIFVHINQVDGDAEELHVGQRVEFDEAVTKDQRTQAVQVRFVKEPAR